MIEKGFKNVFHLEGGIINYLGQVKEEISKWQGECFVFDSRVSVKHDLSEGSYKMCHACNQPLSLSDSKSPKFKEGVHCHKCFGKLNKKQIKRFSERQKQMDLAKKRGKVHLGCIKLFFYYYSYSWWDVRMKKFLWQKENLLIIRITR